MDVLLLVFFQSKPFVFAWQVDQPLWIFVHQLQQVVSIQVSPPVHWLLQHINMPKLSRVEFCQIEMEETDRCLSSCAGCLLCDVCCLVFGFWHLVSLSVVWCSADPKYHLCKVLEEGGLAAPNISLHQHSERSTLCYRHIFRLKFGKLLNQHFQRLTFWHGHIGFLQISQIS